MEEPRTGNANKTKDVQLAGCNGTKREVELRNASHLVLCICVHVATFLTAASSDLVLMYSGERAAHLLHL